MKSCVLSFTGAILLVCVGSVSFARGTEIKTLEDVQALFASYSSPEGIHTAAAQLKKRIPELVQHIITVPDNQRTFANTVYALDELGEQAELVERPLFFAQKTSPDSAVRACAQQEFLDLESFMQDHVSKNRELFKAIKSYADGNAKTEKLSPCERYFLDETIRSFVQEGLLLPAHELEHVKKLNTQIAQLCMQFGANVANVTTQLSFTKEELDGVPASIITGLKQDGQGKYLVGLDYPTARPVMAHAHSEQTRKLVYEAFENRAYPGNYLVLKELMAKRDELARCLGFKTYADYDLDGQMAKDVKTVRALMASLSDPARAACEREQKLLRAQLPKTVSLTADGKIKPWDCAYIKESYRQTNFNVDSARLAEYFPAQHVLTQVCAIYQQFLGLSFEPLENLKLWHDSVQGVAVYSSSDHVLRGHLLFDLYPREGKYSHACMSPIVSSQLKRDGSLAPAVIAIIANFPKPTADTPGLMRFDDVSTFFHEFGHAMHAIVGATPFLGMSGTSVKRDFVEVPSTMFEQWVRDPEILKRLSCHYKTQEPLPDNLIESIIESKKFGLGEFMAQELCLTDLSLTIFSGFAGDIQELTKKLLVFYRPQVLFDDNAHLLARWGHLTNYGAKYYTYIWSEVFAFDLFAQIKKDGLLNSQTGQRLIREILGKGGSADPLKLVRNFLGREPNMQAYLAYLFGDARSNQCTNACVRER